MPASRILVLLFAALFATRSMAEPPAVVADTPIAQSLAAMVLGDLSTPELLLETGGDPHQVQLRPSQVRLLSTADLVIWTSPALTPWLEQPVQALATGMVVTLDALPGLRLQPFADTHLVDDAGTDDHGDADMDHDPHIWLDPDNAAAILTALAAQFATLDPSNAAIYGANATAAVAGVQALRDEIAAILAPVTEANLVMYHDAYGYFATAFGLRITGTITAGDAAEPGAARIAAVRAALRAADVACLFPEANQSDRLARLAIEGADTRLGAPIDPAGTWLPRGPGLYAQTLRELAQAIADCVNDA